MKRFRLIKLVTAYSIMIIIFMGCKKNIGITHPEKYEKIYMTQAAHNPIEKDYDVSDIPDTLFYSAEYGGLNFPKGNISIQFQVNNLLVDSFNQRNNTSYLKMPDKSYELMKTSAVIGKGNVSSDVFEALIYTDKFSDFANEYLLPIELSGSGKDKDFSINTKLQTVYFVIKINSPYTMSLSKEEINNSLDEFKDTIHVRGVPDWSINEIFGNWFSIDKIDDTSFTVSAGQNISPAPQSGSFNVINSSDSSAITFTITQQGNPALDISKDIIINQTGNYLDLTKGKVGQMEVDDNAFNFNNQSFSITLKFRTSDLHGATYPRILGKMSSSHSGYEVQAINRSSHGGEYGRFGFNLYEGGQRASGGKYTETNTIDGEWHHVACIWDSKEKTSYIYVDGNLETTEKDTKGATDFSSTVALLIGTSSYNKSSDLGYYHFWGDLDDVRFWNKAITKVEVYADAANITLPDDSDNLIAGWDFENENNNKVKDVTGDFEGTLEGAAEIGR